MGLEIESVRYAHEPGHTDICYGIHDGQILTCGSDGYVRFWESAGDDDSSSDFVAEQTLSVACTNEHYFVATCSNYVQGYTYSDKKRDKIIFKFSAPVTHVVTSNSNNFVAACSCDMEIQFLEVKVNKLKTLSGHTAPILGLSFDPLDVYLASSSCDGTVKIWELSTASLVKTISDVLPVKNDFFKAVALGRCAWKSMSGSLLAVPKKTQVIMYKRNTWEEIYKLESKNLEKELSAVLFSPCGNYVCGASISGEIIIWEIKHKTEVCSYRDIKKVGISGIVWQPDGNKIFYCDRLGRLSVLTGISDEITRHSVPPANANELLKDDPEKPGDVMDPNSHFSDYEDDENCISLEKIKSTYNNISDDDVDHYVSNHEDRQSPVSSNSEIFEKPNSVKIPELQEPFQPSSTPSKFEPRCLCYNEIGMIRYYDSDKTVDVQFHDTTFHHSLFLRSFGVCTMASLSLKLICLAVPSIDDNLSKVTCISTSAWGGKKEWTLQLPEREDALAVAASGDWVSVATSCNNLRIFTHAGVQKQIIALTGRIVCMSGHGQKLLVVCHSGIGGHGGQNLGFIIYDVLKNCVRTLAPLQNLPISPESTLKWLGFTDEGTACTYDSEGIVRLLARDHSHWTVVCNTRLQKKSSSDDYFPVGISEANQSIRCIPCRNSLYPIFINNPTVVEISLKMPLCEMEDAKSIAEETFWRLMLGMHNVQEGSLMEKDEIFKNFVLPMTQAILKLFGDALNNSEDLRALDLATFMNEKPLSIAIKYASNQGKTYLVEKLKTLKPNSWTLDDFASDEASSMTLRGEYRNEDSVSASKRVNKVVNDSQQDIFDDSAAAPASGGKAAGTASIDRGELSPAERPNKIPINPFRKHDSGRRNDAKGLDCFEVVSENPPKQGKPFTMNKPLKLKLSSSKSKVGESKGKKPGFVEWFGKKKESLSEEHPNAPPGELAKLAVKLYKEETHGEVDKSVEVVDSDSICERYDANKRSVPDKEADSVSKKFKFCFNESGLP